MNQNIFKSLKMIDNIFSDYLMKKMNIDSFEKKLSIVLSNLDFGSEKKFEVSIIKNTKEPFFGMRVFPVVVEMEKITEALTSEKKSFKEIYNMWKNIKNWYIEIDSMCFDRITINFTPKELTALLLHELGHVVKSDETVERFYRAYQESYTRMKVADKSSLKFLYTLYTIPLSAACAIRNWTNGKNQIKQEIFADKVLVQNGYSEYIVSAINKIIKAYGNSFMDDDESEKDKKVETSVKWCNINITDLVARKNRLKDDLFYQTIKSNSNFMKALSMKLINDLGINLRENYTGAAVESSIDIITSEDFIHNYYSYYNPVKIAYLEKTINGAMESARNSLKNPKKIKIPSQYDVDAIFVEIDRISNHHDRIYVLDLIYNKIEELQKFQDIMEYNKDLKRKYKSQVESMLKQLEEMRKDVLAKRNFKTQYKLFVSYPEGYEG